MEKYTDFNEFAADSGINLTDPATIKKMVAFAERLRNRYGHEDITSGYGYVSEVTRVKLRPYPSEKSLLRPFDGTTATFVHGTEVWSIWYESARYIGRPDSVQVTVEYLAI